MLRITVERERKGWSRTKLGYEAKIHPAAIGQIEAGKLLPCLAYQARLERVLGIPCKELLKDCEGER